MATPSESEWATRKKRVNPQLAACDQEIGARRTGAFCGELKNLIEDLSEAIAA